MKITSLLIALLVVGCTPEPKECEENVIFDLAHSFGSDKGSHESQFRAYLMEID